MYLVIRIVVYLVALPVCFSVPSYDSNLVLNPGAETNDLTSWTITPSPSGETWSDPYTSSGNTFSSVGGFVGNYFFRGGSSYSKSGMYQDIDVSSLASDFSVYHVKATLSALIGGYDTQTDFATVSAECYDKKGNQLSVFTIGPVNPVDRGYISKLIRCKGSMDIPRGATRIRIDVYMEGIAGSNIDGYVDDINFILLSSSKTTRTKSLDKYRITAGATKTDEDPSRDLTLSIKTRTLEGLRSFTFTETKQQPRSISRSSTLEKTKSIPGKRSLSATRMFSLQNRNSFSISWSMEQRIRGNTLGELDSVTRTVSQRLVGTWSTTASHFVRGDTITQTNLDGGSPTEGTISKDVALRTITPTVWIRQGDSPTLTVSRTRAVTSEVVDRSAFNGQASVTRGGRETGTLTMTNQEVIDTNTVTFGDHNTMTSTVTYDRQRVTVFLGIVSPSRWLGPHGSPTVSTSLDASATFQNVFQLGSVTRWGGRAADSPTRTISLPTYTRLRTFARTATYGGGGGATRTRDDALHSGTMMTDSIDRTVPRSGVARRRGTHTLSVGGRSIVLSTTPSAVEGDGGTIGDVTVGMSISNSGRDDSSPSTDVSLTSDGMISSETNTIDVSSSSTIISAMFNYGVSPTSSSSSSISKTIDIVYFVPTRTKHVGPRTETSTRTPSIERNKSLETVSMEKSLRIDGTPTQIVRDDSVLVVSGNKNLDSLSIVDDDSTTTPSCFTYRLLNDTWNETVIRQNTKAFMSHLSVGIPWTNTLLSTSTVRVFNATSDVEVCLGHDEAFPTDGDITFRANGTALAPFTVSLRAPIVSDTQQFTIRAFTVPNDKVVVQAVHSMGVLV
eukprot:PhF_6_TR17086/c0_g1_i5/m.26236